jgi:hypothetical protein
MYTKSGGMKSFTFKLFNFLFKQVKLFETRDRLENERREVWLDARVALHEYLANPLVRPYNLMDLFVGMAL